jgi:hypothetical protein
MSIPAPGQSNTVCSRLPIMLASMMMAASLRRSTASGGAVVASDFYIIVITSVLCPHTRISPYVGAQLLRRCRGGPCSRLSP